MTVLIALDYNPNAQKIAESGYALAKAMGAQVVLLHVVTEPVYYATTAYSPIMGFTGYAGLDVLQAETNENLKRESQNFLDASKKHLGDETIQTMIVEGTVSETVLEIATEVGANIIVMGSHSQSWLEQKLIGSQAESVLHHSSIPLFIIPTKKQD